MFIALYGLNVSCKIQNKCTLRSACKCYYKNGLTYKYLQFSAYTPWLSLCSQDGSDPCAVSLEVRYYQVWDFHYNDETVVIPSYFCNGESYTGKTTFSNWDGPQNNNNFKKFPLNMRPACIILSNKYHSYRISMHLCRQCPRAGYLTPTISNLHRRAIIWENVSPKVQQALE